MKLWIFVIPMLAFAAQDPAIVRLFDSKANATIRANACFELRGKSDPETVQALGRAMEDQELLTCAAENLRIAGAIDVLREKLGSASPEVRAAAARELGTLQKPELLESLNQAAQDENALVAVNALEALCRYTDRAAVPYLAALALKGGITGDMALERLAELAPEISLGIARKLLAGSQAPDRIYAMRILGAQGDATDLADLRKIAVEDREPLAQRGRGFGFIPPLSLSRAAAGAIAAIEARIK